MSRLIKATHEGELPLGNLNLSCAVLEDGTRVISRNAIFRAFGRTKRGRAKGEVREPNMPSFIDAKNLQPFIGEDLRNGLKKIEFEDKNGKVADGYNALILPLLCKVYLDARATTNYNTGRPIITKSQEPLARASEILLLSLSKVGIIALIDEATGYQEDRDKTALREFLTRFLKEEKGKWIKTFPDEFFEAIFKMKGWDWKSAIKGQKPGVVGRYINNYVWARIAPGVLDELRRINPKDEHGRRKGKNPQFIDIDFGHPKLKEHLKVLTMFAIASGYNWTNWERMVNRALPKFQADGSQIQEIGFEDA
jgi:hypothetical protein